MPFKIALQGESFESKIVYRMVGFEKLFFVHNDQGNLKHKQKLFSG